MTAPDIADTAGGASADHTQTVSVLGWLSLCRSIRENPDTRAIKILAITAFPENDAFRRMYDAGADLCLMKPLQFDHFKLEVMRLLNEVARGQAASA